MSVEITRSVQERFAGPFGSDLANVRAFKELQIELIRSQEPELGRTELWRGLGGGLQFDKNIEIQ